MTPPARTTPADDATTAGDRVSMRQEAQAALVALVGRADAVLREDQWTAIHALVADRRRALVVQRTGWGKSAVYFVATSLLRARGAGPTVIVSPLLALMRNQVESAQRAGIRAETINSANVTEWTDVHDRIAAGLVDEVRLFLVPVSVGGGTPALPAGRRLDLRLLDERRFAGGTVGLHYAVTRHPTNGAHATPAE